MQTCLTFVYGIAHVRGRGYDGDSIGPGGSKRRLNGCNYDRGACFVQKKQNAT
jgi:hypothetical protein